MKNSHHTCIIETLVNEHRNNDAANELSSSSSVKTAKYCAGLSTTETTAASLHSNLSRSNSLKHFEHNLVINNRLSTVNTDEDIAISDDDSNHFENHCTSTSTFDHLENDSIVLLPFTHQVINDIINMILIKFKFKYFFSFSSSSGGRPYKNIIA